MKRFSRKLLALGVKKDNVKMIDEGVFEVKTPTGVYEVEELTTRWWHVTKNGITYRLPLRQVRVLLHAQSVLGLYTFAREFGIQLNPKLSKNIWVVPDEIFSTIDDDLDDGISISSYLNALITVSENIFTDVGDLNLQNTNTLTNACGLYALRVKRTLNEKNDYEEE